MNYDVLLLIPSTSLEPPTLITAIPPANLAINTNNVHRFIEDE